MIRVTRPSVAMSVQDRGRVGHRVSGHGRSGAMDVRSLDAVNALAGAAPGAAAIETGPGPFTIEILSDLTVAFGGAPRRGAPWWQTIEAKQGDSFELSATVSNVWSYVGISGGVAAPLVLGSRSTHVVEGIGTWIRAGSELYSAGQVAVPSVVDPPSLTGDVRLYGEMPGTWSVGTRADRMGYELEGVGPLPGGDIDWSEPLVPGAVQVPAGGRPFVLMAEAPTVGGYVVPAVVHSEDVRIVAQMRSGTTVSFVSV